MFTSGFWWGLLGIALKVLGLFLVWHLADSYSEIDRRGSEAKEFRGRLESVFAYGKTILACVVVSIVLWGAYGNHTETSEDSEPLYGGASERVIDFEPTNAQRTRHALGFMLVVAPVALHGTWHGRRRYQRLGSAGRFRP